MKPGENNKPGKNLVRRATWRSLYIDNMIQRNKISKENYIAGIAIF